MTVSSYQKLEQPSAVRHGVRAGTASAGAITHVSQRERSSQGRDARKQLTDRQTDVGPPEVMWSVRRVTVLLHVSVFSWQTEKHILVPRVRTCAASARHAMHKWLSGCPRLRYRMGRLPLALDSLWHMCGEAKIAWCDTQNGQKRRLDSNWLGQWFGN